METRFRQGPFAPPAVTRLHRYYEPLRLPTGPPAVIYSRLALAADSPDPTAARSGSLRFLIDLSTARRPQPPRGARPLHLLVASRYDAGFTSGRLATPNLRNEAETGSLALRLTSSPSGASAPRITPCTPGQLHGERAISMSSSFQLTRTIRLRLTHQKDAKTHLCPEACLRGAAYRQITCANR